MVWRSALLSSANRGMVAKRRRRMGRIRMRIADYECVGAGEAGENGGSMARFKFSPKPHADVLLRVFGLPTRGMTPALAESILALDFPDEDAARIEELNVRANEGDRKSTRLNSSHLGISYA